MFQVLAKTIEPRPAPDLTSRFTNAELTPEMALSVGCHELAMEGHLFGHLTFQTPTVHPIPNASQELRHGRSSILAIPIDCL